MYIRDVVWKDTCMRDSYIYLTVLETTLASRCFDMWMMNNDFHMIMYDQLYLFLSDISNCPDFSHITALRICTYILHADRIFWCIRDRYIERDDFNKWINLKKPVQKDVKCSTFHCKICEFTASTMKTVEKHVCSVHSTKLKDTVYGTL